MQVWSKELQNEIQQGMPAAKVKKKSSVGGTTILEGADLNPT